MKINSISFSVRRTSSMMTLVSICFISIIINFAVPSKAAIVSYNSESEFLVSTPVLSTENFDKLPEDRTNREKLYDDKVVYDTGRSRMAKTWRTVSLSSSVNQGISLIGGIQ